MCTCVLQGFFCFGGEFYYPSLPLEKRGLLNLEIAGAQRSNGRVILQGAHGLKMGTKSFKTVAPAGSGAGNGRGGTGGIDAKHAQKMRAGASKLPTQGSKKKRFQYMLRVNDDPRDVWQRIVDQKGIDWLGFERLQSAYWELRGSRGYINSAVQLLAVELWDVENDKVPVMASGEIGVLVGSSYTVLSLFSDTSHYPRCDKVRISTRFLDPHLNPSPLSNPNPRLRYV